MDRTTKFTRSLYEGIEIEPKGLIWHYTDTQGFEGIVRNRTIRLSHPGFLNDPSELQYAKSVYKEMLDKLADGQGPLANKFVSGYRAYEKEERFPFNNHFVASFCKDRDQLELWRQYGDDGRGFSLGFRVKELKDVVAEQALYVCRVLYDRDEQDDFTNKILSFFLSEFQKIHETGENSNVIILEVYTPLHTVLDFFTPFFKHPCYANEQENRLVLHGNDTGWHKKKFLARRGYFKPYIDFKIDRDKAFPLDTVMVGRTTPSPQCENSLRLFLANHEGEKIQIKRSALPYLSKDKRAS